MASKEGSQVEFRDGEEALGEAIRWITSWHGRVRQKYSLTPNVLRKTRIGELKVENEGNIEALYVWSIQHNLNSSFGQVSILELSQTLTDNPDHPFIGRFFYQTRNFDNLVALSFGWRLENSDVFYEMVAMSKGRIDRMDKITRPGALFPVSGLDDPTLTRQLTQQMELSFSYDKGRLVRWDCEVGFEHLPACAVFENGNLIHRDEVGPGCELPKAFDPTPHIKSFMRHRPKEPVLP